MIVQKFGGTSVGTPERMKSVAVIINDGKQKIVVLSATSGTTNKLSAIAQSFYQEVDDSSTLEKINSLHQYFRDFANGLYSTGVALTEGMKILDRHFGELSSFKHNGFNAAQEKIVLAFGELISTQLFDLYCREQGINSNLLPALDFMRIEAGQPDKTVY